jgi:hypothetical protein
MIEFVDSHFLPPLNAEDRIMKSEGGGREFDLRPAIRHFPSAFILCPLNKLSAISRHPVSGIRHPASGIQYPASGIQHQLARK